MEFSFSVGWGKFSLGTNQSRSEQSSNLNLSAQQSCNLNPSGPGDPSYLYIYVPEAQFMVV
jgi:hypothetical protein